MTMFFDDFHLDLEKDFFNICNQLRKINKDYRTSVYGINFDEPYMYIQHSSRDNKISYELIFGSFNIKQELYIKIATMHDDNELIKHLSLKTMEFVK